MLFNCSIIDVLTQYAANYPKQSILYNGKQTITANDLLNRSKLLAYNLQQQGVKTDDVVVIAVPAGVDFLTIIYATMMLRVNVAIIDPEMGRELYASKIKQLNPKWAFVDTRLLLLQEHPIARYIYFRLANKPVYFPKQTHTTIIGCGWQLPLVQKYIHLKSLLQPIKNNLELEDNTNNHDFLITYTSGTLQAPKGVLHSFSSLDTSIKLLSELLQNKGSDALATYLPHFVLLGIAAKLPVYIYDPNLSAKNKLAFFETHKITTLFGPPSDFLPLIQYCEQHQLKLPFTLNHILLGSAPIHKSFLNRLIPLLSQTTKVTCMYGMTEHLLISTISGHEKINYTEEGDIVGKPVNGIKYKIAEDGELLIQSNQLYSRYYHLAERDAYHATGDLARIDKQGSIVLMGRKKEMIIRGNTNIYPALYEDTIKKIAGIEEVAMVGIFDPKKEDEVVYLAVEASMPLTEKEIYDQLAFGHFQIEKTALPDKIMFMKIPKKGRQHKIDRIQILETIKTQLK